MQIEKFCQCVGCTEIEARELVSEMEYVFGFSQERTFGFLIGLFENNPVVPFKMFREYVHALGRAKEVYIVSRENGLDSDFEGVMKALFILNEQGGR